MKSFSQKPDTSILFGDIRRMIEDARTAVATAVNAGLTTLYWRVGKRISEEILKGNRAGYGQEILATLSQQSKKKLMIETNDDLRLMISDFPLQLKIILHCSSMNPGAFE